MIVSDFLRAQFLATKGTRHRIRMDCLFCVVATVLCTDARCRHRLMHRRAVSPPSYAPTRGVATVLCTDGVDSSSHLDSKRVSMDE